MFSWMDQDDKYLLVLLIGYSLGKMVERIGATGDWKWLPIMLIANLVAIPIFLVMLWGFKRVGQWIGRQFRKRGGGYE